MIKPKCQHEGCVKSARSATDFCISHGGGRRCHHEGCGKSAVGATDFCRAHGGGRRCHHEGCGKSARSATDFCRAHGGGRRCQHEACVKSAIDATDFCVSHGGGRRCQHEGCGKGAEGATDFCKAHGGGRRCHHEGCGKSVQGATDFCKAHGGGRRCHHKGCGKSAQGTANFCVSHGGGRRCQETGCSKSAQGATNFCKAHGGGNRCVTCRLFSVPRKGADCYSCRVGKGRIKQFELETMEFLKEQPDLCNWTLYDTALPCRDGEQRAFRPDVLWVLEDRYVILEIDEHEHRVYCTVAEEDRLHELRDELQHHGVDKYLVVIRYNPNEPYQTLATKQARLAATLRDAFQTCEVQQAPSGILKLFVGYTGKRRREIDREYAERTAAEMKELKRQSA